MFLQEVGRAGRKRNSTAKGLLLFNEYIDDKHLGQWLKSSLGPKGEDPALKAVKLSILDTYIHQSSAVHLFDLQWEMLISSSCLLLWRC